VPQFGEAAVAAVPALIENLHNETLDVREAAAVALGRLGPDARDAVPDLIGVLQDSMGVHVRAEAARALGRIGDPSAVPALAATLYEEEVFGRSSINLDVYCAASISLIADLSLPDGHLVGGHQLNEEGVPLVVIAAREWWESEGIHQAWPAIDE
jgi:HEAT repeat protein